MEKDALDESWQGWLKENLERGCDTAELAGILRQNGFSDAAVRAAMDGDFPGDARGLTPEDYKAISETRLTRPDGGARRVETDLLQLFQFDDFMTAAECEKIIALSAAQLRPSTVTTGERDKGYRTSSTCDLALLDDPFVESIDEKIARALGIRLPYSEGIQAQRYEVGQEFRQHTDYFQPGTGEYQDFGGAQGNRTWTFMVYLNTVAAGGGTKFFALDKVFTPVAGRAVIWNNLRADGTPNAKTLHAGLPVEQGHKIIITKWFRERGAGPMFYPD
ncbi:MAG: proline hydroxylase [Alphaproteobacteria bacterium]|nr:proline hydroxylase [Alphaproteobacteria bacterium]